MASAVEEVFSSLGTTRSVNLNSSTSSSVKSNASRRQAQALLHLRFQSSSQSAPGSPGGRVYDVAVEPGASGLAGRGTPLVLRNAVAVSPPAPALELPRGHAQRPGPLRHWPAPRPSARCLGDTQSAPARCQRVAPKSPAVRRGGLTARRGKVFRQVAVQSPDIDDATALDCDEIELPPPTFFKSRLSRYCGHKSGYEASSKELQRRLADSMARSFPKDVWDACDLSHPDEQVFTEKAGRKSTMDLFRERLNTNRRNHEILHGDDDVASVKQEAEAGRMLALLAQESGWQVLDVEEVRDVFLAFAPPAGSLHVEGPQFSDMMRKLYSDSNLLEIKQICEEIMEREGVRGDLSEQGLAGRFDFEVDFCCFFRALTMWLDTQTPFAIGRRCTLSRFTQPPCF